VFLLRLLHGLYEDCDGGVVEQAISSLERCSTSKSTEALNFQKTEGVGVKLEDIGELLSAACSSLEDEIEMQTLAAEVVQALFEEGQRKDLAAIPATMGPEKKRPLTRSTRRGLPPPSSSFADLLRRAASLWGPELGNSGGQRWPLGGGPLLRLLPALSWLPQVSSLPSSL
jgi:hypothetical protein